VTQIQSSVNPVTDISLSPDEAYLFASSRGSGGGATDARIYQILIQGRAGPVRVFQNGVVAGNRWVAIAHK